MIATPSQLNHAPVGHGVKVFPTREALDANPEELRERPQWVTWRAEPPEKADAKGRKTPYTITGRMAKSNNPATWTTHERTRDKYLAGGLSGIGFVFSEDDPYTGIDLDECIDDDGSIVPEAQSIIDAFNSYTEVSPSGKGVKIWIRGAKPRGDGVQCKRAAKTFKEIEIYDHKRFYAVTGSRLEGTPNTIEDRQDVLDSILIRYGFVKSKPAPKTGAKFSPVSRNGTGMSDEERCKAYLRTKPPAISGNGGHDKTLFAACECVRRDLDSAATWRVMQWWNDEMSDEKWTTRELQHKIESAEKVAGHERGIRNRRAAHSNGQAANVSHDVIHSEDEPQPSRLVMRCAADVQTRKVDWFWQNRFVAGAINLLVGMVDVGKGVLTCDLAARTSTGTPWPPVRGERAPNETGSVVFLSMEDSPETTIVPRLRAAGADLRKIQIVEAVERVDVEARAKFRDGFDITRDVHELENVRKQLGDLRLVIIDPLDSYLNAKLDTGIGNKVRAALWPLKDWAESTGVTVLIVHHFNKTASTNAMDRVSGARSFGALPRSVWIAGRDEDFDRTLLMPAKLNLVRREDRIPLSYTLRSCTSDPDSPVVSWRDEEVDMTAEELLGAPRGGSKVEEAADWLRDILANGPLDAAKVQELADGAGLAWSTVKRAKAEARVIAEQRRADGRIVGWDWRLASRVQNVEHVGSLGPLEHVGQGDQGDQGDQGSYRDVDDVEGFPI